MEINKDLLAEAEHAKNAEELKTLAKENGVELSDEQANAYFAKLGSKGNELTDDELDSVAGGDCTTYHDGCPVVIALNRCEYWVCETCGTKTKKLVYCDTIQNCANCGDPVNCGNCLHSVYEDALLLCKAPERRQQ